MQKGHRAWLKALYATKNPYTGLKLGEDPAIAILELQNEDSLLWWGFSNIKGDAQTMLRRLFGRFPENEVRHAGKSPAGLAQPCWMVAGRLGQGVARLHARLGFGPATRGLRKARCRASRPASPIKPSLRAADAQVQLRNGCLPA